MILSLKTELAQLELTYVYFIYGSPKMDILLLRVSQRHRSKSLNDKFHKYSSNVRSLS